MQKEDKAKTANAASTLEAAFEALKTYDWGAETKPLAAIDLAIVTSRDDEKARNELENGLVAVLNSDASLAAKDYACRKLMIVGSRASVPSLAKLLADEKLSHMARFALERLPAPEAQQALRVALRSTNGKQKIGVIGSLGGRGDGKCVVDLKPLLADADEGIACAAAAALGNIATLEASWALEQTQPTGDKAKLAGIDAELACAEALLADKNKDAALKIYKSLATGEQPKHVKLAGTRGMLACAGK